MFLTARSTAPLRRGPIVLVAVLVAIGAAVVVRSSASAQAPTTRTLTFKELEKGSTFTHIRNTKTKSQQSNSQGDVIAFTNPLADATGQRIGMLYVGCTTTAGSRDFKKSTITCIGTIELRDGSLMVQLNARVGAAALTGAVTGGTGAYANARGVFSSSGAKSGADDTITLVG
jgi:hypothetical protein